MNNPYVGALPPSSATTPALREIIQEFMTANGRPPASYTELGDYLMEAVVAFYSKDAGGHSQVAQRVSQVLRGYGIQL